MASRSVYGVRYMRDALRRAKRHAYEPDAIQRTQSALMDALSDPAAKHGALLMLAEYLNAALKGIVLNPDHLELEETASSKTAE